MKIATGSLFGFVLLLCCSCSSSGSGTSSTGGAGGGGGSGGSGGGGSGGTSATGGGGGKSPGTASLEFETSSARTYCDKGECGPNRHIFILDANGEPLAISGGDCYTPCGTCEPQPCPGYACEPQGYAVTTESLKWDGTYFESSTCGAESQCLEQRYMPAGTYKARMCATPGDLAVDALGAAICTPTGTQECVEVSFELPSDTPVVGKLPD